MKKFLAVLGLAPFCALAEGSGTSRVPTEFTTAISDLQATGEAAASAISPMVLAIGIAFAVIALLFVAFRYFKRSAR